MADLIDAARLTPPPQPVDWAAAERHLQAALPEDYRGLADAGGAGLWFGYIRLFTPGDAMTSHDLLQSVGVFEDRLILWEDDPELRPEDLADDSRLIAWANTEHGETLFWRVDPSADPSSYPIYVESEDGESWERFDLSTTDFLLGLLHGTVHSEIFSSAYLRPDNVYQPYRYR